eukprot:GHVQ01000725.1.p3 GENE.GHVQ01000725.1~~GHVQ01000725.1.p3  ORF type:complete len:104 (+),score=8.25 GHVQ01000725.1:523-834(+)
MCMYINDLFMHACDVCVYVYNDICLYLCHLCMYTCDCDMRVTSTTSVRSRPPSHAPASHIVCVLWVLRANNHGSHTYPYSIVCAHTHMPIQRSVCTHAYTHTT